MGETWQKTKGNFQVLQDVLVPLERGKHESKPDSWTPAIRRATKKGDRSWREHGNSMLS